MVGGWTASSLGDICRRWMRSDKDCSLATHDVQVSCKVTVSQARLQEFIRAELSYFAAQHTQACDRGLYNCESSDPIRGRH